MYWNNKRIVFSSLFFRVIGNITYKNTHNMKRIIVTTILSIVMKVCFAYDFNIDGIYYTYDSKNQSAIVTSGDNKYFGDITIPAKITYNSREMEVKKIDSKAFYECDQLTSVKIMSSRIYINQYAFYKCSNLTSIYGNCYIISVGKYAFYDCKKLNRVEGTIVGGILEHAFENCESLFTINLKNSILSSEVYHDFVIGQYAFAKSGLISIVIDHRYIHREAFNNCVNLKKITICNTVVEIKKWAFANCKNLMFLDIKYGDRRLIFESSKWTEEGDQFLYCNPKYVILGRDITCSYFDEEYHIFLQNFKELECLTITNDIPNIGLKYVSSKIIYIAKTAYEHVKCKSGFDNSVYINSPLYVPTGRKNEYSSSEPWKNFFNIQEMDIKDMMLDEQFLTSISVTPKSQIKLMKSLQGIRLENINVGDVIQVFTLDGNKIKEIIANCSKVEIPLFKGFYIVKIGSATLKIWI